MSVLQREWAEFPGGGAPGTEGASPCLSAFLPRRGVALSHLNTWPSFCRTDKKCYLCVKHRVSAHRAASSFVRCRFWSQAVPGIKPDRLLQFPSISFLTCKMGATIVTSLVDLHEVMSATSLRSGTFFCFPITLHPRCLELFLSHSTCSIHMC